MSVACTSVLRSSARVSARAEVREPRPEPDVHGRRVLRLDPPDPLERRGQRHAPALQEQLAAEHRPVQLPLGEDTLSSAGHGGYC